MLSRSNCRSLHNEAWTLSKHSQAIDYGHKPPLRRSLATPLENQPDWVDHRAPSHLGHSKGLTQQLHRAPVTVETMGNLNGRPLPFCGLRFSGLRFSGLRQRGSATWPLVLLATPTHSTWCGSVVAAPSGYQMAQNGVHNMLVILRCV